MRKYLFQKIYSNSVRTVRFCAILHLSHPPTPSSVREKLHQPGAANKTKFLRSPGPSPPGWAAHRHCLSCPQLLLQRPRSGQVWPIVVDPTHALSLPVEWRLYLGQGTAENTGALLTLTLACKASWEGLRLLPFPPRCSAFKAGVSLREAHHCPQPNCRVQLRHFIWRQTQAVKPVAPNLFPKELTLFASEYGEAEAKGCSQKLWRVS